MGNLFPFLRYPEK